MKRIYKYILLIFLIWTIVTLLWYFIPHRLLNVSYETNKPIKDLKGPMLVIASHNYPAVDAMVMCNESKYMDKTLNIVSASDFIDWKEWFKNLPYYTAYNKINLKKNKKNNLTKKCTDILNKGENVLIFLEHFKKNKGIYYILKESKVPILFVKIYDPKTGPLSIRTKEMSYISNCVNKNYKVDYELVNDYNLDQSPEDFMNYVLNKIYK